MMGSQVRGLKVAAAILWLMSLAHVVRLMARADVSIAGHHLPLWASVPGALFLFCVGLWFWVLSVKRNSSGPHS